jgi:hypothetical protein
MAIHTTNSSFQEQFKAGQMDIQSGPRKNKAIPHSGDKYHVSIKDTKGKEYRIDYI